MYVFAPNQVAKNFPYSIGDLRRDNPSISFPAFPSPETLAEWSVFPVIESPQPDHDPITENLSRIGPSFINGEWAVSWEVTPADEEVILDRRRASADYLAFWDELVSLGVYASIREQSFVSLPMNTLATEFIALLTDAKAKHPNETAIQASINAILSAGTFTEEHLEELQHALEVGSLDGLYSLPVN